MIRERVHEDLLGSIMVGFRWVFFYAFTANALFMLWG